MINLLLILPRHPIGKSEVPIPVFRGLVAISAPLAPLPPYPILLANLMLDNLQWTPIQQFYVYKDAMLVPLKSIDKTQ
jgi:hypothetical protein